MFHSRAYNDALADMQRESGNRIQAGIQGSDKVNTHYDLGPDVTVLPYGPGEGFPLFVTAVQSNLIADLDTAVEWFREHEPILKDLLLETGAVVFRDFAFRDTDGFNRAIAHLPEHQGSYVGGAAPRAKIAGRAFEATQVPSEDRLPLHQEMAYLPHFPKKLAFFCKKPAETGGATLIGDVRRFEKLMPQAFRERVKQGGVTYVRNFRDPKWSTGDVGQDVIHRPWTDALAARTVREAEAACEAMGLNYCWEKNGSLSTSYTTTGFTNHPDTGREIWFNQITSQMPNERTTVSAERRPTYKRAYTDAGVPPPYNVTFGDGGVIDPAEVAALYPILDEIEVSFPWQQGDLMLLDNFWTFHGRSPFTGKRDIQVALLA